jgi:hypothetical protein
MNKQLEQSLFNKYPTLFPNGRDVDPMESLICFGIECDDGWYELINKLCYDLVGLSSGGNECVVVQIKEKFGGLRFYVHGNNDAINSFISKAEKKSYTICETCGKKGKVRSDLFWIQTLCNEHYKKTLLKIKQQKSKS